MALSLKESKKFKKRKAKNLKSLKERKKYNGTFFEGKEKV